MAGQFDVGVSAATISLGDPLLGQATRAYERKEFPDYVTLIGNWGYCVDKKVYLENNKSTVGSDEYVYFGNYSMYPTPISIFYSNGFIVSLDANLKEKDLYSDNYFSTPDSYYICYASEIKMKAKRNPTTDKWEKYEGFGAFTLAYDITAPYSSNYLPGTTGGQKSPVLKTSATTAYKQVYLKGTIEQITSYSFDLKVYVVYRDSFILNTSTIEGEEAEVVITSSNELLYPVFVHRFLYSSWLPDDLKGIITTPNIPETENIIPGIFDNVQLVTSNDELLYYSTNNISFMDRRSSFIGQYMFNYDTFKNYYWLYK